MAGWAPSVREEKAREEVTKFFLFIVFLKERWNGKHGGI